jgi:hypothetical protein
MARAGRKFSRYRHPRFKMGDKPVIFDPDSEYAIQARLEAVAERLRQQLVNPQPLAGAPPNKRPYLKSQQEESLRRARQKWPDGNFPRTAEVQRAISDRKFHPSYNTVHAALDRKRPKK